MNRAQTILHLVAASKKPLTFADILAGLSRPRGVTIERHRNRVAAQLHQLTGAGKLKRDGTPRNHTYARTDITLVDRRRVENPVDPRSRRKAAKAAPAPRSAAAKPTPPVKKPAASTAPVPERNKFSLGPKGPPNLQPGERETVEQFLARGGRIQKLRPGECSDNGHRIAITSVRTAAQREKDAAKRLAANTAFDDVEDDAA